MPNLYEEFEFLRDEHNSIIILGLDPKNDVERKKVIELSKIEEGLIGFKPNLKFYQDKGGRERLIKISENIAPTMIKILDLKSSDGWGSNKPEIIEYAPHYNYFTIAPAGGCIEETIEGAIGLERETISMGAMSFPGVLREATSGFPLFVERVDRAIETGTSAFVLGATAYVPESAFENVMRKYRNLGSDKAITEKEFSDEKLELALRSRNSLFKYIVGKMKENPQLLALVPGFGRQGGNLEYFLESGIDLNRCMINAGSDILKAEDPRIALAEMNQTFNRYRQ